MFNKLYGVTKSLKLRLMSTPTYRKFQNLKQKYNKLN